MFVLPSLGRPHHLRRFIDAAIETKTTLPIIVWIGTDDPFFEEYKKIKYPKNMELFIEQPMFVGEIMQKFFYIWPNEQMYGYLSDDCVPRTKYWDKKLEEACGDWYFAYPNEKLPDLRPNHPLYESVQRYKRPRWNGQQTDVVNCNFPMVGGKLVRELGGFMPIGLQHFETDVWWQRVAVALGVNRYQPQIILEHMHKDFGKAEDDDTYRQKKEGYRHLAKGRKYHGWKVDQDLNNNWWKSQKNLDLIERIKAKIFGTSSLPSASKQPKAPKRVAVRSKAVPQRKKPVASDVNKSVGTSFVKNDSLYGPINPHNTTFTATDPSKRKR